MIVKVLIKRKFSEEKTDQIVEILNKFRSGAVNQPGYVSGETLFSLENPKELLVISTWQSLDHWEKWKKSYARKTNEEMLAPYQVGPTEYAIYMLGKKSQS